MERNLPSSKMNSETRAQRMAQYRWILRKMQQHWGKIALVCLLTLAGTTMTLASSVASKYLVDAVSGKDAAVLFQAAWITVVCFVSGLLLQGLSSRISAKIRIQMRNSMQQQSFSSILYAAWESLEPYQTGDLLNRLNSDIGTVSDGIIGFVPGLLSSLAKFAGAFVVIFIYDPVIAVIALVSAPVTFLLSRLLLRKLRRHEAAIKELSGKTMSFQEDSLRNLTSIKAFAVADRRRDTLHAFHAEMQQQVLSYHGFRIAMNLCLSAVNLAVSGLCLGWGVWQLWQGNATYGSLMLFLQLANMLRGAFTALVSLGQQAVSITTSAGRVMTLDDLPREDSTIPQGLAQEQTLSILLNGTRFCYRNDAVVLDTFHFQANAGETIAVIGPSGEGKTTLLRLLLGLVSPGDGTAELVGKNRYPITAGTRCAFSYVPQGNSLFSGTIAQNLRIAAPNATEEELKQVLMAACAWEFVRDLPGGLDYAVNGGGQGLSEGQAQRLAIARALLHRAPILLLDEATSALDGETELRLLHSLRSSGRARTCILVTHRSSAVTYCDRVYRILDGQVAEISRDSLAAE